MPGGFADTVDGMTVFESPPPRLYMVLGRVTTTFSGRPVKNQMTLPTVHKARSMGADALIAESVSRDYLGTVSTGGFQSQGVWNANGNATVWPGSNTITGSAYGTGVQTGTAWGMSAAVYENQRSYLAIKWR